MDERRVDTERRAPARHLDDLVSRRIARARPRREGGSVRLGSAPEVELVAAVWLEVGVAPVGKPDTVAQAGQVIRVEVSQYPVELPRLGNS